MNWFEAAQTCHLNGMKVVSIESQAEQDRIESEIKKSGE